MKEKNHEQPIEPHKENFSQQEAITLDRSEGERFLEDLKEKSYNENRTGQAFVMPLTNPRKEKKPPEEGAVMEKKK